ncbi:hypothetical protein MS3_00005276, partial [Schistosoma haematobium]
DPEAHVHHWFGIRVFQLSEVDPPCPPTRLKRRIFAFRLLNSVKSTLIERRHTSEFAQHTQPLLCLFSVISVTAICQMESEVARNAFRDTSDYRTNDPYIEDLINIWLRKCIRSKSNNPSN